MEKNKKLKIVQNTTCYLEHEKVKVSCNKKSCDYWINSSSDYNCVNISTKNGPKTLEEIGKIYDLTRMRICQIEKAILNKIRKSY